MSIARSYAAHLVGLTMEAVAVEVDISNGLNAVSIVGLGDRAVEEAKDRISAAIKNSGYLSPKQKNQKVVISLAPADVRKEGTSFDLAMAVAYLSAAGEPLSRLDDTLVLGELSLEGRVRKIAGALPILCQAGSSWKRAIIPAGNADEASLSQGIDAIPVASLAEAVGYLSGELAIAPVRPDGRSPQAPLRLSLDMSAIRGHDAAKRALEIAAAGGHNVLMFGPPGTGKTMLAESLPSILPPLTREESIEVTGIYSAARGLGGGPVAEPPFRAPHHTASYPAIVGGGSVPKPGEITLAHRGVLFLDEFPEFDREVIEALRQPLEDREITVARAKGTVTFPASCMLVASMNPCPCGKARGCTCRPNVILAYRRRISGPILDRIDLWIRVHELDYDKLAASAPTGEPSASIRERVIAARARERERFERAGIRKSCNAEMSATDIDRLCAIDPAARAALAHAAKRLTLSGRSFHRIMKVARTIADLDARDAVSRKDVFEALHYRQSMDGM